MLICHSVSNEKQEFPTETRLLLFDVILSCSSIYQNFLRPNFKPGQTVIGSKILRDELTVIH
jgi:hypothetical protein